MEETVFYLSLARRFGLAVTGGSDFHGPGAIDSRLGVGRGDMDVPREIADKLIKRYQAAVR